VRIGRRKRVTLVACAALATCVVGNPRGHASPEPDIESTQQRVDDLYHLAEQASERYNELRTELRAARTQLSALKTDVGSQQEVVDTLSDEVGDIVAAQAQGTPAGPTAQLISSGDPDAFLSGLAAMQAYNVKQNNLLDTVDAQQAELQLRVEQLQEQVDAINRAKLDMTEERAVIDEKFGEATALLEELEAEERAAIEAERRAALEAERRAAHEAAQRSELPQPGPDAHEGDAQGDDSQDHSQGSDLQADEPPADLLAHGVEPRVPRCPRRSEDADRGAEFGEGAEAFNEFTLDAQHPPRIRLGEHWLFLGVQEEAVGLRLGRLPPAQLDLAASSWFSPGGP